jgi:hypothetical protein
LKKKKEKEMSGHINYIQIGLFGIVGLIGISLYLKVNRISRKTEETVDDIQALVLKSSQLVDQALSSIEDVKHDAKEITENAKRLMLNTDKSVKSFKNVVDTIELKPIRRGVKWLFCCSAETREEKKVEWTK